MKIYADEVKVGDEVSYYYEVWRGFENYTPVKTGYREVIGVEDFDIANNMVRLTFRDSSTRVFSVNSEVELKQDWDKVEYDHTDDSQDESQIVSPPSNA